MSGGEQAKRAHGAFLYCLQLFKKMRLIMGKNLKRLKFEGLGIINGGAYF